MLLVEKIMLLSISDIYFLTCKLWLRASVLTTQTSTHLHQLFLWKKWWLTHKTVYCVLLFFYITFSLFFDQCGKKQDISRLKEEFFFSRNGWFTTYSCQFCFIIVLHCWDSDYMVTFVYMVTTASRKQTAHDHVNHCAASLSIFKFPFDSGFTQHTMHLTASGFHWWQASFMFY